ncbi:lipase secretion chaperone [Acinetobacter rongchengensis]|uniref:Lipase chaperone n=1 Tax=Acinetobacter rongchengensis TaxID=2419601 RepID=A0A3A8ETS2_9GAMM|nr:lipase secretion chaperone [Acinetobacter rongchengensis]RKG37568.1 chromosome segregation ATPase [Acinetobacter rongchengensis]
MNKRLLLTIIVVLAVLVAIVVWKSTASSATVQQTTPSSPDSSTHVTDETIQNKSKDELLQTTLLKQLQSLQKQPGNITQFLNDFKANCQVADCDAALAKALANYPDQTFAQLVENLLKRMPQYEQRMQSTVLSTSLSPKERFDTLWKIREQTLGQAEAMLGFGQERHYADYRFAYQDLAQNQNLSAEQRLKAFEELQRQYPNNNQQESKIGLYEQAVTLLNQGNKTAETERLKQELQQRYLTQQERLEIQQRDQREVQQQQQANQYQQAVSQLQQEMEPLRAQLSDAEWQKQYQTRLENLRLKMFP